MATELEIIWNEFKKHCVETATGDDEGNKQIAQYNLAISLYRLKLYQASYNIFSVIADNPNHVNSEASATPRRSSGPGRSA